MGLENVEDVEGAKSQRAGRNYGGPGMDAPRLIQAPCPGFHEPDFEACLLSFGVCWSSCDLHSSRIRYSSRYMSRMYQKHHSLMPNVRIQELRSHRSVPEIRGDAGVVNVFAPTRLVRPLLLTTRGLCRAVLLELAIPLDFKQKFDMADAATVR